MFLCNAIFYIYISLHVLLMENCWLLLSFSGQVLERLERWMVAYCCHTLH